MTQQNRRQSWEQLVVDKHDEPHRSPSLTSISTVPDETDSKELEIHRCLTANCGGSDDGVDLIHLRKLAESPGGLKTMALRRLAWPKLVAAHQVLWDGPPLVTTLDPMAVHSREIHRLVQRTKWSKYQITKSPKTFDELLGLVLQTDVMRLPTPRPSFADLSDGASDSVNANSTTTTSNRVRRVSFDLDLPLDDVEEPSHRQLVQMARDERQLLRKLLSHIYRCHPDAPLYDGLQNLIAVLWIVIESPSLTSITSLQLIQYQWMPQSPTHFMKLLSLWDPALYEHFCLQENSDAPPACIANSWIPHWFSSDLKDLDVLLRIWDVLIVHPPITVVYFAVALVVHFRDSLLRAKQQPIFQAILHHLPSDGLEKYDMVEPILQQCLQALQDYPPKLFINSASVPPIPEWVFHSTAPTDSQVIQRLAEKRLDMCAPNPCMPMIENNPLEPTSSLRNADLEVTLTAPKDERSPWHETPDATPCSTPESVRSVRTTFQSKETPKLPTRDISSINWFYKILPVCGVGMAFLAVSYSLILHSSHSKVLAMNSHDEIVAPPNFTADTISKDEMDHSMATLSFVAPLRSPYEESRPTSTPNYVDLAWPDSFQITTSIPIANSMEPTSSLDTDVIALFQVDYGGQMCHPIHEFNAHLQFCEDPSLSDSWLPGLSRIAISVSPQDSNTAWLVHGSMAMATAPFTMPESRVNGEEMLQLGKLDALPNASRIDCVPAPFPVDYFDSSSFEPSTVPTESHKPLQPKVKPTWSSLWSKPKYLVMGLGNFLMASTEAHLRGRREAHTLVVNNLQRFVHNQADGGNRLLHDDVEHEKRSSKQTNQIQEILKVIQKKGKAATTFALEATAVRLDARQCARAKATQLVATLAQQSKIMMEDSIERVHSHFVATRNRTLNTVGMTARAIALKGDCIAHQLSSVATPYGSNVVRALHNGIRTKYANMATVLCQSRRTIAKAGQPTKGRMRGFALLKPNVRHVGKEDMWRSQTVNELWAIYNARHSGALVHVGVGVSILSDGGKMMLRESARLWDQLSLTLPKLRMLLRSGKQLLEVGGEKGMSMAVMAALSIKQVISKISEIGTLPSTISKEFSNIMHSLAHEIFHIFSVVGELGLHVVDLMEDASTNIGETILATIVSALMSGKRTYRSLENGGRSVLLASRFVWNCVLVYLTMKLSATRQRIFHNGVHSWVDMFVNSTDGLPHEHLESQGAFVAAQCVLGFADGNLDLKDCPPHSLISGNVTNKPPGQHHLYASLVGVQPVEVNHWAKVRPAVRRSRGAADVAREALRKKSNRNVSIAQPFVVLEEDFRMMNKATLQGSLRDLNLSEPSFLLTRFTRQSRKILGSVFKLQELRNRTKKLSRGLAQVTGVISKTCSHFLANVVLRVHYLQSILGMLLKNHRDRLSNLRGPYLNLTLRETEHSALLVSYNMLFVIIALIEVGKKKMQHFSERQITAVQHLYLESWRGIENAAVLRKDNMSILMETIVGTIAKVKSHLARTRS